MAELRLLGPVELWVAGRRCGLGPARQRVVLAVLAVELNRPIAAEALIDRVWGEAAPAGARSGLYSYVTRLRRALSEADVGDSLVLDSGSDGYVLRADADAVDLHRVRRLMELVRGDLADERRAALLSEAVGLWRGEPLAGVPGVWADRVRQTLVRQRLDVTLLWARAELGSGRPAVVIEPLREVLAEHPLVEPAAVELMRALHADGRSAEALECYAATRDRFVAELGVEPGDDLRRLQEEIARGEGAPAPVRAPVVPSQLPGEVFGFTGRMVEVGRLDRLLSDGQAGRAVVISAIAGTAGVGKPRIVF